LQAFVPSLLLSLSGTSKNELGSKVAQFGACLETPSMGDGAQFGALHTQKEVYGHWRNECTYTIQWVWLC
jgi:hypothetical protein